MIKEAINKALYAVFPRRCELCGEVTAFDEHRCEECKGAKRITGEICNKCGREKEYCVCEKERFSPSYKAVAAPYYFEGSRKIGVYRLKSSGYTELARAMAEEMANTVKCRFKDIKFDCVCSVPLTKNKFRKRGYNQSELLAKALAERLSCEYVSALTKIVETESQRTSSAKDRRLNLYGAFDINESTDLDGKTVLIADDVKTTGSTLNECAEMLRAGGAKAVYACAFTVTNKKGINLS